MASNRATQVTLIVFACLVASTAVIPVNAHPPALDHGIPENTFHKLWSGDQDGATEGANLHDDSPMAQLGNRTDIPFDSPPSAVEQWNRADHREFPATDSSVSIHPPDADLTNGRFIRDAYTEVFAVHPSTRARISPSRQPLYVAPEGTVRGTVDSRVVVPADDTTGDRRVYWSLDNHQIEATTLLVDGDVETDAGGTHTPALSYTIEGAGAEHRLTLKATISVRLRKKITVCTAHNDEGDCTNWVSRISYPTQSLTVADSIGVTSYDLSVSGFIARYPNGDLGLRVYKNQPWLGYDIPEGDVRGVWRFYSARDTDWDTLVHSSRGNERITESPLHPLQVTAYPIETGPTPSPRGDVTILDLDGRRLEPPTLPSNVNLDVLTESYTASYGIATRTRTTESLETIRAWGLVRGVHATRSADEFARVEIHESNLTLTIMEQTDQTVTIRGQLQDAVSGAPINTDHRDGYVVLNGQRLNTSGNGTVTITLARPLDGISARYEPGHWWLDPPGYTSDSDTVLLQGAELQPVGTLFHIGVLIALFLLAVFLTDRITRWRVWPPWRGL